MNWGRGFVGDEGVCVPDADFSIWGKGSCGEQFGFPGTPSKSLGIYLEDEKKNIGVNTLTRALWRILPPFLAPEPNVLQAAASQT